MEKKLIIGLDLDDVLVDCYGGDYGGICAYLNNVLGTTYVRQDLLHFDLEKVWGCEREEMIRHILEFYNSSIHADLRAVSGAAEGVAKLSGLYDLTIVTSRPEVAREATMALVCRRFPLMSFAGIHFLGQYHGLTAGKVSKGEICKKLNTFCFIEDNIGNAFSVSAAGIPVFLFDQPWNKADDLPPLVRRVFGWGDILELLSKEDVNLFLPPSTE